MYTTCLRCERPLGTNAELPHLSVGRRVAFDTTTGRLWVVCVRCGQWNLTPIEERWEALAECERLAAEAEARVSGGALGLARTQAGLELLRVGGVGAEDIANWRYGRRLAVRQRVAAWLLLALGIAALALGFGAARLANAPMLAVYVSVLLGVLFLKLWHRPPRLWARIPDGAGGRYLLWPWQVDEVELVDAPDGGGPWLLVPHARGQAWHRGLRAAAVLAGLLPKLNRADCADVDVGCAVQRVADAEAAGATGGRAAGVSVTRAARRWARERGLAPPAAPTSPRRPWERLTGPMARAGVHGLPAELRLALEMAVTEEVERAALRERAAALAPQWREEEVVGAIADALLVPEPVVERLAALRARRAAPPADPAGSGGAASGPAAGGLAPRRGPA